MSDVRQKMLSARTTIGVGWGGERHVCDSEVAIIVDGRDIGGSSLDVEHVLDATGKSCTRNCSAEEEKG